MFESIWEDVKQQYRQGNMITRLIIANTAVFIVVNVVKLFITLFSGFEGSPKFETFIKFFSLSNDLLFNLTHPWVFLTSMFLHEGFFHFLFNMLFLYWFGRIVGDLLGNHRILPLYLMGGLAGGVLYLITANFIYPGASYAYGASAAVMAIVAAAGTIAPDYIMRLILIGDVKLKYIVAVLIFLDIVGVANMSNTGGHFAHLGGAAFGFFFVRQLQGGTDWSDPVNRWIDSLVAFFRQLFSGKKKGPKVAYRNPERKKKSAATRSGRGSRKSDSEHLPHQEKLDAILEKIKESGYDSLTDEEKEFLFNASKK
jgi:membrane associated rhomboid family serine protease